MDLKEKIEWVKNNIDIRNYLESCGYTIDKERDCKKYRVYASLDGYDIIVVPMIAGLQRRTNFFSQHDTDDKGSIIDFVMSRENKDFTSAVEHLVEYAGNPEYKPYLLSKQRIRMEKKQQERSARRHQKVISRVMNLQAYLQDDSYLTNERKLFPSTLYHKTFLGRVFSVAYNGHTNIAFPLHGKDRQVKSMFFKNSAFEKMIGSKSNSLWISHYSISKDMPVDKIIVGEHPIDLMSHFQQNYISTENNIYISYLGNPAHDQIMLLNIIVSLVKPAQVVLANDNDKAGASFDEKLIELISSFDGYFVIDKTVEVKDWNDLVKVHALNEVRMA